MLFPFPTLLIMPQWPESQLPLPAQETCRDPLKSMVSSGRLVQLLYVPSFELKHTTTCACHSLRDVSLSDNIIQIMAMCRTNSTLAISKSHVAHHRVQNSGCCHHWWYLLMPLQAAMPNKKVRKPWCNWVWGQKGCLETSHFFFFFFCIQIEWYQLYI